jgi:sorbose reductase
MEAVVQYPLPMLFQDPPPDPPLRAKTSDRFSLAGLTAVVTDCCSEMGYSACVALLQHGVSKIFIMDFESQSINYDLITKHRNLCTHFPGVSIRSHAVEKMDEDGIRHGLRRAVSDFDVIDILICFPGIPSTLPKLSETSRTVEHLAELAAMFGRRYTTALYYTKAVGEKMIKDRTIGRIVYITGSPTHDIDYCGMDREEAARPYNEVHKEVLNMARYYAVVWAKHRIRVNCITHGYMDTEPNRTYKEEDEIGAWQTQVPMGRLGEIAELAGALVLLASDAGSYMDGSNIVVDGGHLSSAYPEKCRTGRL